MDGYKLYIRVDDQQRIIDGYADWQTDKRSADEILICEDGPRHFQLYWTERMINDRGQHLYKWINGQRAERSLDELDAEWAARPPTPPTDAERIDQLTAQNATMLMDAANKAVQIVQQQQMIASLMMTVAQLKAGGAE
ncbi:hypothetical protein COLU111180_04065 [Cohnella lubricantis]|uniref:Uncharacterized protein n=1 Tax=Cohnella lubricantis TaxID=2163172 RepID=A0A841T8Y7_9BACL|nr:hypothetical protein [Cohnella lubricantis]MBB6676516.1 hypothetical protein [Cohnella lubricantis]MBP2117136.1 hypothetical protein [Cohnella lubricantis]